jgi:uncharacterized membrane protein YedE/YeeE
MSESSGGFNDNDSIATTAPAAPKQHPQSPVAPKYEWLQAIGGIYTGFGVVVLALSLLIVIAVVVVVWRDGLTESRAMVIILAVLVGIFWGVVLLGLGQAIYAFRDLARNSWLQIEATRKLMTSPE